MAVRAEIDASVYQCRCRIHIFVKVRLMQDRPLIGRRKHGQAALSIHNIDFPIASHR